MNDKRCEKLAKTASLLVLRHESRLNRQEAISAINTNAALIQVETLAHHAKSLKLQLLINIVLCICVIANAAPNIIRMLS